MHFEKTSKQFTEIDKKHGSKENVSIFLPVKIDLNQQKLKVLHPGSECL